MNMNLKTAAHDTLESVEKTVRGLREKIAASMTEDDNATWNKAVDACAEVVEQASKRPETSWGQVKAAVLTQKR
jgi:hypothetical protein